jgi:hypothetical protein
LSKLGGGASDQYQEVVLPAEIVIRQSSGRARVNPSDFGEDHSLKRT